MTDSYISELQKPDPSAVIDLYELELVEGTHYATGNPDNVITTYCWHSGTTAAGASSIVFNSVKLILQCQLKQRDLIKKVVKMIK